jgi:hypothetical protein
VIDDGVLEAHGDDAAGDLGLVPSPVPAGKDAGEDQFAKNTFMPIMKNCYLRVRLIKKQRYLRAEAKNIPQ